MQAPPPDAIKLYRHPLSGHSHRVELFLRLLGLPVTLIDVDFSSGELKAPAFLALNRFGQVPVIDDGGNVVSDSNAILTYRGLRYGADHWVPREPLAAARVQQWLSQSADALARGAATARAIHVADVALYTYAAHAPEGSVALDGYPAVREWIAHVEGLPGFVPMVRTAVGLQANA